MSGDPEDFAAEFAPPRRPATQIGLMVAILDYLGRTSDDAVDVPLGRAVLEAADAVLAELRRPDAGEGAP